MDEKYRRSLKIIKASATSIRTSKFPDRVQLVPRPHTEAKDLEQAQLEFKAKITS